MTADPGSTRSLDDAPGVVGLSPSELPPLPDAILTDPSAGRLDPRLWFHHPERPFELEIGSGKGTFLVHAAAAAPGTNFLGTEWEAEYYFLAADRIRRRGLANVRMLRGDATEFIRWRCPSAIVRVVHLYFSDPWPKRKHHKNRVIQDAFLREAHRVLEPGGELRVVTDHDELWAWDVEHFARVTAPRAHPPLFELREFVPPAGIGEGELVGTNFERKYRDEGRSFHAVTLRRSADNLRADPHSR